jgi:hypothetical protein
VTTVTFTGKNFTTGTSNSTVCVRYFALNSSSQSVTVNADFVPKVVKLVFSAQMFSPDETNNLIGELQIIVPRAQLTGNFTLNLKMDGVKFAPLYSDVY